MSAQSNASNKAYVNTNIKNNDQQKITGDIANKAFIDGLDSALNIVDGGLFVQQQAGYSTLVLLTDNRAFAHVKYVDDSISNLLPPGLSTQYIRGDKTLGVFQDDVRATLLTGLPSFNNTPISATDTTLQAFAKLQGQITNFDLSGYLKLDGTSLMAGNLQMNGNNITQTGVISNTSAFGKEVVLDNSNGQGQFNIRAYSIGSGTYMSPDDQSYAYLDPGQISLRVKNNVFDNSLVLNSTLFLKAGSFPIYIDTANLTGAYNVKFPNKTTASNQTIAMISDLSSFGSGTVTSVGITGSDFSISGSPVTTSGNIVLSLATVNSNVGTFNNVTVNAKGLVTAASNVAYLTGNQSISLTGEATGSGATSIAVTLTNSSVIGKVLTGYVSGAGTVSATDNILQAIQKLNGNDLLKWSTSGNSGIGLKLGTTSNNQFDIISNNSSLLRFTGATSGDTYLSLLNSNTTDNLFSIQTSGTSSNINLRMSAKGTGNIMFGDGSQTTIQIWDQFTGAYRTAISTSAFSANILNIGSSLSATIINGAIFNSGLLTLSGVSNVTRLSAPGNTAFNLLSDAVNASAFTTMGYAFSFNNSISGSISNISGSSSLVKMNGTNTDISITSGSANYNYQSFAPAISQSGATGLINLSSYTPTISGGAVSGSFNAIYSTVSAGTNVRFISHTGTALSYFGGNVQLNDTDIIIGSAAGTKIGQSSSKLGLFGATPIIQPTTSVASASLVSGGLTTIMNGSTFDGYTIQQVVKALRNLGILA